MQAKRRRDGQAKIGRQHDQIAMGQIDQPHDPEHKAEPGGEQRIKPAHKHALQNDIKPDHAEAPK